MRAQPDIDPQAGYGVYQALAMWRGFPAKVPNHRILDLADNPYKLYTVLRAVSLGFMDRKDILQSIRAKQDFPYADMLAYICKFCNLFRADIVTLHLTGVKTCQSDKAFLALKSKKPTSRGERSQTPSSAKTPKSKKPKRSEIVKRLSELSTAT